MKSITVLFWNGLKPTSIVFRITEEIKREDILNMVLNSDMEIIRIYEDFN